LDEIAELPLAIQSKWLRVLEEKRFDRVGGTQSTEVDVRIIAATNKDLHAAVTAKMFREDLFFRVAGVPITICTTPWSARPFLAILRKSTPPSCSFLRRVPSKAKCRRGCWRKASPGKELCRTSVRELPNTSSDSRSMQHFGPRNGIRRVPRNSS